MNFGIGEMGLRESSKVQIVRVNESAAHIMKITETKTLGFVCTDGRDKS